MLSLIYFHNSNYKVRSKYQNVLSFLPYDGVFEAQFGGHIIYLLLKPSLWSDQIFDKLRHPPDRGVPMQALQTLRQILWNSQWQVGGPWMEAIHNRQLNHLHSMIVIFTYTKKFTGNPEIQDCIQEILANKSHFIFESNFWLLILSALV